MNVIRVWSDRADFYNYLQHGIDFLISGDTHVVKKMIVHSNIVCDPSPPEYVSPDAAWLPDVSTA